MIAAAIDLRTFDLQSLAQVSSERMLNCAVEGIGIALLAWVLLRALGQRNSGTRFVVWFSALLGIAGLPFFGSWASSGAQATVRSSITLPGSWALYMFASWALIAAAGMVRIGIGLWHVQRLRKRCTPIDVTTLDFLLQKTLEEFDSPRPVTVCLSDYLQVPTAIGFIKPLVVIPYWAMQELSPTELNAVLLHELAHLRRWDDWTNLLQKIVGALLFFHPAVWWIEKRLGLEREMACDDMVLAKTANPRVYAECLISLAEKSFLRRGLALAQAAVDRIRPISLRIAQILDVNRPSATRVWRPAPVLLAGMTLAFLIGSSSTPRLVSFENTSAASQVAAAQTSTMKPVSALTAQDPPMSPRTVPAKFEVKPEGKSSVSAVAKARGPGIVSARSGQPRANVPVLVRSSASEQVVTPRTMILITQTELVQTRVIQTRVIQTRQLGSSGWVVWDVCVWQVTVVSPAQNRIAKGIVAKST
jgi:beta-lactamase regulating signal transducer with metallopeptidase domain